MEFLVKPTISPSNIGFCSQVNLPPISCPDPVCPAQVICGGPCPPVVCSWVGCGGGGIGPMEISVAPVEII